MLVGAYGPVVFEVSEDRVRTFQVGSRERGATFAVHDVLGRKQRLEPLEEELAQVKLEINLDANLGTTPAAELYALNELMRLQLPWPLFLGPVPMGEYVLTGVTETWRRCTRLGILEAVTVVLALLEDADGVNKERVSRVVGV